MNHHSPAGHRTVSSTPHEWSQHVDTVVNELSVPADIGEFETRGIRDIQLSELLRRRKLSSSCLRLMHFLVSTRCADHDRTHAR